MRGRADRCQAGEGGRLPGWLRLPGIDARGLDDPETTEAHRRILESKPFLRRLYEDFYREVLPFAARGAPGPIVELGSGGGFLSSLLPGVVRTDVLAVRDLDLRCSGLHLPFRAGSLKIIFLLDVFHHLPDVARALREFARCLRPGGHVVMVEPAVTSWSSFVWSRLHHEPFDPGGSWRLPPGGPLSGANSALPWIVFHRDRERFEREHGELRLVSVRLHTGFLYLLSGGFSVRQLVPGFTYPLFRGLESLLAPFRRRLAMFQTIVLERRAGL